MSMKLGNFPHWLIANIVEGFYRIAVLLHHKMVKKRRVNIKELREVIVFVRRIDFLRNV